MLVLLQIKWIRNKQVGEAVLQSLCNFFFAALMLNEPHLLQSTVLIARHVLEPSGTTTLPDPYTSRLATLFPYTDFQTFLRAYRLHHYVWLNLGFMEKGG